MEYQPKILPKRDSPPEKAPKMVSLVLKPIGYPLRAGEELTPFLTTDDPSLFQQYARSQWVGLVVKKGNYLFDSLLFPDYAFRAVAVEPNESQITETTTIILEQEQVENKSLSVKIETVTFSDIIGQMEAKEKCSIIAKFLSKESLMNSVWAPRNILFWGPPGNGKTMMALALSQETNYPMFLVKASDLLGVYVGDGARKIQKLFAEARNKAPSIVFIDELDTIALKRNYQSIRGDVIELVTSLLGELDGVEKNQGVVTIASTNQPEILDHAILSRFEQLIEFKMPNLTERREILIKYASTSPIPFENIHWETIVQKTKGWSGRDLKEKIIKNAIHSAILHDQSTISMKTMLEVLKRNRLLEESMTHYS
ncbi:MAG: AAA family ATPase [Candidatus Hodarchaeales archaeon]